MVDLDADEDIREVPPAVDVIIYPTLDTNPAYQHLRPSVSDAIKYPNLNAARVPNLRPTTGTGLRSILKTSNTRKGNHERTRPTSESEPGLEQEPLPTRTTELYWRHYKETWENMGPYIGKSVIGQLEGFRGMMERSIDDSNMSLNFKRAVLDECKERLVNDFHQHKEAKIKGLQGDIARQEARDARSRRR